CRQRRRCSEMLCTWQRWDDRVRYSSM
ncbi:uncharacterized protein METZ01_LOCUS266825, partial [marine metagenome]